MKFKKITNIILNVLGIVYIIALFMPLLKSFLLNNESTESKNDPDYEWEEVELLTEK